MNEYQIASIVGGCIGVAGIAAYIFSWVAQWVWAWVDDSKCKKENWIASKFPPMSKWRYPVYLRSDEKPFGYAKRKELENCFVVDHEKGHPLVVNVDYKYDHDIIEGFGWFVLGLSLVPLAILVAVKIYPATLCALTIALIAFLARFARRTKKALGEHVADKTAHDVGED